MKTPQSRLAGNLAIRTLPLLVAMVFNPALAEVAANVVPTGGQIVAGQGALQQTGNALNVLQNSAQMIANWQSFNIGQQATVNFIQPDSSALILNRVIGADPSQIFGQMRANGQVMLINPNGILFGASAQINVGALMASTQSISNEDFLAGRFKLSAGNQAVRNAGSITAAEGGFVLLAGAEVENTGTITANAGAVALAAGKDLSVTVGQTGLLKVKVETAAAQAAINNTGVIIADGGQILLTANQAAPLAAVAINQSGVVRANTLNQKQGEVWIDGGAGGVSLAGQTTAAAMSGKGGRISATGQNVVVSGKIDASGANGGGAVYLGGGWQGNDPAIAEAARVDIRRGADITANANTVGDGGTVVVWSGEATRHDGAISASGAAQGNGGQVETSSRGALGVSGSVTASAAGAGKAGQWLLDPTDITVVAGSGNPPVDTVYASSLEATLNGGTSVNLLADRDIAIRTDISKTNGGDASLSLLAGRDILLDTGADISSTKNKLNVNFGDASRIAGTATLKGTVNTNGGNVTFHKETVLAHAAPISTKVTETSSVASGNITFNKDVQLAAQAYSVSLNAQGAQSGGVYTGPGGDIIFNGSIVSIKPDAVPLSPQALSLDSTGSIAGNIVLGAISSDRIGGVDSSALRSLTLAGDTDIALKAGTINLLNTSGDVLTASNIANTTSTITLNADTVINVNGGSVSGLTTGYADYRQQTFNISGVDKILTINAARSIKLKNTGIDVRQLSLNSFAASGATAGSVLLDGASLTTHGGTLFIGKDGGFATGFGGDPDGVTDGVRISNSTITTHGGNLLIKGEAPITTAAGAGVKISGALTEISTGAGSLTINGKVANQAGSGNKDGVVIGEDGASRTTLQTSSGKLTIEGDVSSLTVTPTGGTRYDGLIISSKALIKTDSGDIQLTGKGGGGSHAFLTENHGIRVEDTETSILSTTGDITLSGTSGGKTSATSGENSFGIYTKGQNMYLGSSSAEGINATGVITVEADSMEFVNSSDYHLNVASSGELRIRPLSSGRHIEIGTPGAVDKLYLGNDWFNGSNLAVFRSGFGSGNAANPGVTIGRTDASGRLTVASATTFRDNTAFVMGGSGGKVLINAALTVKATDTVQSRQLALSVNSGATGNGVINTNKLLLNGSGDVVLGGGNLVDTLSANLADRLDFTNAKSLLVGEGSYTRTDDPLPDNPAANVQTTIASNGILTSDDAVNLTLSAGDLILDRNVNVGMATVALTTQVGGMTEQSAAIITADKLALFSVGTVSLDNVNQINVLAASVSGGGSDLKFSNGKSLLLDRVGVTPLTVDNSATISVAATQERDGVSVNDMTRLNLTAGHLSQSGTQGQGRVTTSSLKLTLASGDVTLGDTTNDIGTIAANLSGNGRQITVKDKSALIVGTVDGSNGIRSNNGNITLAASSDATSVGGDLALVQQIHAGTADVRLSSGKGAINETAATGIITANELKLTAVNTSTLDSNNAVDEFTAVISGANQGVRFSNTRSLVVGDLDSQSGIIVPGDVRLTLAHTDGSERHLTQTQDVKAGGLNVASDTGDITLERTSNEVGKLAARLDAAGKTLKVKDKDGIDVASVDGRSGIQTNAGDINLVAAADAASTAGDLTVTNDITTGGASGTLRLSSLKAAVSGSGKLSAQSLLAQSVSGVNLDNKLNDVDIVSGLVSAAGTFVYKDVDTLEVGTVNDAANVAVHGVTTRNGDIQLSVAEDVGATGGDLNLTQSVVAGGAGKNIALQAYKGKVSETANVTLSADQLQLLARDTTQLTNPATGTGAHHIGTLAASITGPDQTLTFFNTGALTIGSVTASDTVNPLHGVTTASSGHIAIATGNGSLTLDKNVNAGGAGSIDLRAGEAGSDIRFNGGQAKSGSGTVQLLAARDISTTTNNNQTNEIQTTGDVLLQAGRDMGADGRRIEIADADKLAAAAGGNVWLHKTRQTGTADVKVDAVTKTTYNTALFGGEVVSQRGIRTDGNIALNVADGRLLINQDIQAQQGGTVDLRTGGNSKDIVFDTTAAVISAGNSGDRRVQLISSGNVLANGVDADSNDEVRTSGNVLIAAAGSIGSNGNRIETANVNTLATESGSEQWLRQTSGNLTIGSVAALTPADNGLARTAMNLGGLVSKQGNSAIRQDVVAGQLVIDKTVSASGSGAVDLRASDAMTLQSGARVKSQTGNLLLSTGGTFSASDSSVAVQTIETAGGSLVIEANGAIDLSQGKLNTSGGAGAAGGEIYVYNHGVNGTITVGQSILSQGGSNGNGGVVTLRNQNGNILLGSNVDVSRGIGGSRDGTIQLDAYGDITDTATGNLVGDTNGQLAVKATNGKIDLTASANGGHQMGNVAFATMAEGKQATVTYRDKTALTIGTAGGQGSALAGPVAAPSSQLLALSGVHTQAGAGNGTVMVSAGGALTLAQAINTQPVAGVGAKVTLQSAGALLTQAEINTSGTTGGGDVLLMRTGAAAGDITVAAAIRSNGVQGGSVTLSNPNGSLALNSLIDASGTNQGGRIQLGAVGDIKQTAALKATGAGAGVLKINSTGEVMLENTGNNVDVLAAALTGSGKALSYVDTDQLTVSSTASYEAQPATSGVTTRHGALSLKTQSGDLIVAQAVSSEDGAIVLNAARDALVNANVGSGAGESQFKAGRDAVLLGNISTTAALAQVNAGRDVTLGGRMSTAGGASHWQAGRNMTLDGNVETAGGAVNLTASGNLLQRTGSMLAGAGRVVLSLGGAATQSGSGRIEAGEFSLSAADSSSLMAANNVATLAATVSKGGLSIRDANGLQVGRVAELNGVTTAGTQSVTVDAGDIDVAQVMTANGGALELLGGVGKISINAGLTANDGDLRVRSTNGAIALNGDVNAAGKVASLIAGGSNGELKLAANVSADTVILDTVQDIVQQGGALAAQQASVIAGGRVQLEGAGNRVGTLAAKAGGALRYQDAGDLTIATVNAIQGASSGGELWVRSQGNVTLNQRVTSAATGNNALVLVAGKRLYNKAGGTALQASNGRWLAYDDNPFLEESLGGLPYSFRRLRTSYDSLPENMVVESGNGYLTTAVIGFTEQYVRLNGGVASSVDGASASIPAFGQAPLITPSHVVAPQLATTLSRTSFTGVTSQQRPSLQSTLPLLLQVTLGKPFISSLESYIGDAVIQSVTMGNGGKLPDWLSLNVVAGTLSGEVPAQLDEPLRLIVWVKDLPSNHIYSVDVSVVPKKNIAQIGLF